MTALQMACSLANDNDEIIRLLIDKTSAEKVCCFKVHNTSPVHLLCKNKEEKLELVRSMLDKLKAESTPEKNYIKYILKKEDTAKSTIAHLAIGNNHCKILELLFKQFNLNRDIREGKMGNYLVHSAARNGSVKMLRLLQQFDAVLFGVNSNRDNALHVAAEYDSSQFIREFLWLEKEPIFNMQKVQPVQMTNKDQFTPLMTALAFSNQKCVEELISSKDIQLDCKDIDGNSIYHIMAKFNNSESLKYFLARHLETTKDVIFSKNNLDESVFHVACRFGHLEIIKMILNKLNNTNYTTILNSKNLQGQTCFHLACDKGYHNIVEYFLRDRRCFSFLEHLDNESNSCLHLASEHGHAGIVSMLLDLDCDLEAKNEQNLTPLDLSCRNGFFEISKMLIQKYSKVTDSQTPLHTAAAEGAHEVVKLLLDKGAIIDKLDEMNRNCLDIAISKGHREVVKVLLEDPNWDRLIRFNNEDQTSELLKVITADSASVQSAEVTKKKISWAAVSTDQDNTSTSRKYIKRVENPEILAMFENKMWDSMNLLLDRCIYPKYIDFTKIDMPLTSISKHPLMLIARSGQENLIKHQTTLTLLNLKWRFLPRLVFISSLLFYLLYLILLLIYCLELNDVGNKFYEQIIAPNDTTDQNPVNLGQLNLNDINEPLKYSSSSITFYLLAIVLFLCFFKQFLKLVFIDRFGYFASFKNILELSTYVLTLASILTIYFNLKAALSSFSIFIAFIVFPLYIQEVRLFGIYVVAFFRTLANSAKFFPIFFLIYLGFFISFRLRSNFGVNLYDPFTYNSTIYGLIRTFTLAQGEISSPEMGIGDSLGLLPNAIIYILFLIFINIILINLLIGIAVGEIKTVLDEADLQRISMRIIYVLKVESTVKPLQRMLFPNLKTNYTRFYLNGDDERRSKSLVGAVRGQVRRFVAKFRSKQLQINLIDPQKRLEDTLMATNKQTNEKLNAIRSSLTNQTSGVEVKLNNSQTKIEDSVKDLARETSAYLESLSERFNSNFDNLYGRVDDARVDMNTGQLKLNTLVSELHQLNEQRFAVLEDSINNLAQKSFKRTNSYFDFLNCYICEKFLKLEKSMRDSDDRLLKMNAAAGELMQGQMRFFQNELRTIRSELVSLKSTLNELKRN